MFKSRSRQPLLHVSPLLSLSHFPVSLSLITINKGKKAKNKSLKINKNKNIDSCSNSCVKWSTAWHCCKNNRSTSSQHAAVRSYGTSFGIELYYFIFCALFIVGTLPVWGIFIIGLRDDCSGFWKVIGTTTCVWSDIIVSLNDVICFYHCSRVLFYCVSYCIIYRGYAHIKWMVNRVSKWLGKDSLLLFNIV